MSEWDAFPVAPRAAATPVASEWAAFPVAPPATPARPGMLARIGNFADGTVRQIARGVTMGASDEIGAGLDATVGTITGAPGTWNERYTRSLTENRARDKAFETANPITSTVAQIAGGVALPIGVAGRAATMGGAMLRGAGTGAAMGGTAGYLEGEGDNRIGGAVIGAGLGAGVGALIPPAFALGAGMVGNVAQRIGAQAPDVTARRMILRDMSRDGVDPATLAQRAGATDKPEMLADLGGENILGSAAAVARLPGAGRQMASEAVAGRGGAAQGERLANDVRTNISGDDFRTEIGALLEQRSSEARPLYERAWNIRVPGTLIERLEPITNSPIGQDAMRRGIRVMEEEGRGAYLRSGNRADLFDPEQYGLTRGADGEWALTGRMQNLRLLDAVKRGMDDIVGEAVDPVTRRQTQFGRAVDIQRRELVAMMRDRFPAYRDALDAWAGPSLLMDATRLGRRLLTDGVDQAEHTAAEIARLSPSERDFFRTGVAQGLLDRIHGATDAAELTRLNQTFGSERIRQRLRAAFDTQEQFDAFANQMQREVQMARTNAQIKPAAGSQTMPLQERRADLASPPSGPVTGAFVDQERAAGANIGPGWREMASAVRQGGVTAPLGRLAERVIDARRAAELERNSTAMAPYLFTTDPAERARRAGLLMQQALRDQQVGLLAAPTARAATRAGAIQGGLLAQ